LVNRFAQFVQFMLWFVWIWMLINAIYMLIIPKTWFRLPRWLRVPISFTEAKNSSGLGAFHVRITGFFIVATIAIAAYSLYFS
jgi:hypothetical protein